MIQTSLDFEIYSEADLRAVGAWRYAEHPSTEVLCCAHAVGDAEPALWLPGMEFPASLFLADEAHAWNAEFEYAIWLRVCVRRYGWPIVPPEFFRCSMSLALSFNLPGRLDLAARVLGVAEQKDTRGTYLITKLCKPRPRTSKANAEPRWTPATAPDDFAELYAYCRQDVRTERAVVAALPRRALPPIEQATYLESLKANARGITIDAVSVEQAIAGVETHCARLAAEHRGITGGLEPTQPIRVRAWLFDRGVYLPTMQAETIDAALESDVLPMPDDARRVLEIRRSVSQVSVRKFHAMRRSCCNDGRIHGMLQYHGAGTGRWAGRLVQLQNLAKPAKELGRMKAEEWIERAHVFDVDVLNVFGDPMAFFSAFVRPCLVASPGKILLAADFSAIECRVLAWLAGEHWLLDTFASGGDVYVVQATDLFGFDVNKTDHPKEREVGKRIVLGCGYQMGAAKFAVTSKKYGAPVSDDFAAEAVQSYRRLNRRIVQFWYDMQAAAELAIRKPGLETRVGRIGFRSTRTILQMKLPSGRLLTYWRPRLEPGDHGPRIVYEGVNSLTKQWGRQETYGGRLVENATQAVARDLCRDAILRMSAVGYDYLFSSHDEIVSETDAIRADIGVYCRLMEQVPEWAAGCPIAADGWIGQRYRK